MEELLSYRGKVRNMYNLGNNYYLMEASDRVSSLTNILVLFRERVFCLIK